LCGRAAEREEDIKLLEGANVFTQETIVPLALDADEEDLSGSSGSSSDEEDEEAELLAELERIRKERAEDEAKKKALKAAEEEEKLRSEAISGNPLLQEKLKDQTDFRIKRKWDDDVVFRNQASKQPIQRRRFINDTIRNDFHKRFLDRYMK
jgi:protein CWC15